MSRLMLPNFLDSSSDVYILRDDGQDDEFVGSPIVISYPESRTVKVSFAIFNSLP